MVPPDINMNIGTPSTADATLPMNNTGLRPYLSAAYPAMGSVITPRTSASDVERNATDDVCPPSVCR